MLPFKEDIELENVYIRRFSNDIKESELKWHWDEEDRIISPVNQTDWRFQFDNQLPIKIEGDIEIKKGVWHRVIKGNGELIIRVKKIPNM